MLCSGKEDVSYTSEPTTAIITVSNQVDEI